jgi:hypothetical protein
MFDPPMSAFRPHAGARTPIDMMLRDTGSVSMMSRVMLVTREPAGRQPAGLTGHRDALFERSHLHVGIDVQRLVSAERQSSRVSVLKPVRVKVSL